MTSRITPGTVDDSLPIDVARVRWPADIRRNVDLLVKAWCDNTRNPDSHMFGQKVEADLTPETWDTYLWRWFRGWQLNRHEMRYIRQAWREAVARHQ
jgi:hypothetical protein